MDYDSSRLAITAAGTTTTTAAASENGNDDDQPNNTANNWYPDVVLKPADTLPISLRFSNPQVNVVTTLDIFCRQLEAAVFRTELGIMVLQVNAGVSLATFGTFCLGKVHCQ